MAGTLLILPDAAYLKETVPANLMLAAMDLAEREGWEFHHSVKKALALESVRPLTGLPGEDTKRLAQLTHDKSMSLLAAMDGAPTELARCMAAALLVEHLERNGKVRSDSTAYLAARWILDEADSDGKDDWSSAKGAAAALPAGKYAAAFL